MSLVLATTLHIAQLASGFPLGTAPGAAVHAAPMPASSGLLDLVSTKSTEVITTARVVMMAVAVIGVVATAIKTRALAAIVMAGLVGGFAAWLTWHMTDVQNRTGNEIASGWRSPASSSLDLVPGSRSVTLTMARADL